MTVLGANFKCLGPYRQTKGMNAQSDRCQVNDLRVVESSKYFSCFNFRAVEP